VKIVSLDVHKDASQLAVVSEAGEVLFEMKVATEREALRRVVRGIAGPKRVVFEEGPLSGMLHDALGDLCEEVVSCDPSHNALIALAEDSNDERDARRLAKLAQMEAVRPVYVPPEPYRTLRSLLVHDEKLQRSITGVKNRIQGLCGRHGLRSVARSLYTTRRRQAVMEKIEKGAIRWQMESLCRLLDQLRQERVGTHRVIAREAKGLPEIERIDTIPGAGPITARTLVAWIADPKRFRGRSALCSYGGLGLGQGYTDWKPISRARASKRGNRAIKRVLFLAARAAVKSKSALARRYEAQRQAGLDERAATRNLARTILFLACSLWKKGKHYDDTCVAVPDPNAGSTRERP
jgi:transposase